MTTPTRLAVERVSTSDDFEIAPSTDLPAELPGMHAAVDASRRADGEIELANFESMRAAYEAREHFSAQDDLIIARLGDRIVGYARAEWLDSNDGERWYESTCIVHPDVRGRGLGALLLAFTERRRLEMAAADLAGGVAADRRKWLTGFNHDGDVGGTALLARAGYEPFRRFHSMRRPDFADIPDLSLPAGLEIRPIQPTEAQIRAVIRADNEAFQDHFGRVDSEDSVYHEMVGDPDTDVSLWAVAFDGDQIAGAVLNGIHAGHDGEPVGWLDSIFTRRPWRQRGLARALIARSLSMLRDRGVATAALGVDAANPNQALHLYESCGFAVASSSTAWRKPLPPIT